MDPEIIQQYNLNAMNTSNYRAYLEENKSEVKPEHFNYVVNTTHTDEKFEVFREDQTPVNMTRNGAQCFQDDTKDQHYRDSFYSPKNQNNQNKMNFLPTMLTQDQVNSDMKKFAHEDEESNMDEQAQMDNEIGKKWR